MPADEPKVEATWYCPSCGVENTAETRYCAACERELPEVATAPRRVACPVCGAVNTPNPSFCRDCGRAFPAELWVREIVPSKEAPVPGLYMGRDPALNEAAAPRREQVSIWTPWRIFQVFCAVVVVLFIIALLGGRARPPGGIGLIVFAGILAIGASALWQFYGYLMRTRGR